MYLYKESLEKGLLMQFIILVTLRQYSVQAKPQILLHVWSAVTQHMSHIYYVTSTLINLKGSVEWDQ